MSELAARNAKSLHETIKLFQEKLHEHVERLQHLERQVAMHSAEINTLRQMVVTAIASRGSGPTAR